MVKRVFFLFLAVCILAAPVLAAGSSEHSNSLGQNIFNPEFVGFSYYSSSISTLNSDFFVASNGVVPKFLTSQSNISLSSKPYLYFIYEFPYLSFHNCKFDFYISLATSYKEVLSSAKLYRGVTTQTEQISLYEVSDLFINNIDYGYGLSSYSLGSPSNLSFSACDFVVVELCCKVGSDLDTSISFSESGSLSGSYSGTNDASTISVLDNWGSSAWELVINVDQYSTVLYEYGEGQYRWWDPSMGITSAYVNTPFFGGDGGIRFSESASSESGTMSLSETGTISSSDHSSTMAYSTASVVYGNDGGLVDEVFDQGETLDQIAGDMSQIVEDMQAKQDAANDIAVATTEDQITGTQETMSSGVSGINSGLDLVQSMDTFSADAFGYVTLLTRSLPVITGIGNGVISWAFVFPFVLSALIFIFKRLR